LRIVIADDEAVIRLGLKTIIENMGHRVVGMAANGEDAVAITQREKPDVLLLDIRMPLQDGLEAAEILEESCPTAIVMLTAYSQEGLIKRAAKAGIMGYLVKPIREETLGPTLELASAQFKFQQALQKEMSSLEEQQQARDLIEKAKRLIVAKLHYDDAGAYLMIQQAARQRRIKMVELARQIIDDEQFIYSLRA
jgi:two-component system, response regulator PdtaR